MESPETTTGERLKAEEAGETLLGALAEVDRALQETRAALEHATHRAKDALEVILLLKHQVLRLRMELDELAAQPSG